VSEIAASLKSVGNLPFTIMEPEFHTKFISVEDQTESSPVFVKCFEVESVAILNSIAIIVIAIECMTEKKGRNLSVNWKEILILQIFFRGQYMTFF